MLNTVIISVRTKVLNLCTGVQIIKKIIVTNVNISYIIECGAF